MQAITESIAALQADLDFQAVGANENPYCPFLQKAEYKVYEDRFERICAEKILKKQEAA